MIYFILCILEVYFDVFKDVNAFTGGMNFHLWKYMNYIIHFIMFYPVIIGSKKIFNDFDLLIYIAKLVVIYVLVRFFIFDYAYGFFAHGDFSYLGNSIYDTIIGAFPVWLIASIKSAGFLYAAYLNYKKC